MACSGVRVERPVRLVTGAAIVDLIMTLARTLRLGLVPWMDDAFFCDQKRRPLHTRYEAKFRFNGSCTGFPTLRYELKFPRKRGGNGNDCVKRLRV